MSPNERVIWLTTCNRRLWEASGERLIRSFLQHQSSQADQQLWLLYEVDDADDLPSSLRDCSSSPVIRLVIIDYRQYPGLVAYLLQHYSQAVPVEFGGQGRFYYTTPQGYFRYHAVRFLKKVDALSFAFSELLNCAAEDGESTRIPFASLLWLDCDCFFEKTLPSSELDEALFGENDLVFLKSRRAACESGFLGWRYRPERKSPDGRPVLCSALSIVQDFFVSGEFLHYPRWDDGYIWACLLPRFREKAGLVYGDIAYDEKGGHVFPYSRLAGYIAHDKGRHGRAFSYLKQGGLLHVAGAAPIERYAHPGG